MLDVDNGRAKLVPDGGPVDVTAVCVSRDVLIKLLRGQINPVVMALQAEGRLQGDRERGVKIVYGLRAGSPFVANLIRRKGPITMSLNTVSILDGNAFVVSDRRGDIDARPVDTQGLFLDDTRFLSRWILTVNGLRPTVLSVDEQEYFQVQFFEAVTTSTIYVDSHLSVARKRAVGKGFHEEILVENHDKKAMDLDVQLDAACDFADLFEVKDKLAEEGGALHEGHRRSADARLQARTVRARDVHLGQPEGRDRREGFSLSRPPAAADLLDRLARRAGLEPRRRRRRRRAPRASVDAWVAQRPPAGLPRGSRCSGSTAAAWWTWRRLRFRTGLTPARCRRRGSPGSWPCSAATA